MTEQRPGSAAISPWRQAVLAAELLAVDPAQLGGAVVTALPGPVRDRWLDLLRGLLQPDRPVRKIPLQIGDERLLGGLDLAATLAAGRTVAEVGLLAEIDGGVAIVPMAERIPSGLAARIVSAMDLGRVVLERDGLGLAFATRFGVVALDERMGYDEQTPAALSDRLAFALDLSHLTLRDTSEDLPPARDVAAARSLNEGVEIAGSWVDALVSAAVVLGIDSLRAPLLAMRVARVNAALDGRTSVTDSDIACAVGLVLAPRATRLPSPEPDPDEQPPDQPDQPDTPPPQEPDPADPAQRERDLADMVLEAVRSALPADLLAHLLSQGRPRARSNAQGKSGAERKAAQRGRPIGVARSAPRGGQRLDLIATLRAAAPWQRLRRDAAAAGDRGRRIEVRKDDFRTKRYRQRSESTTIFAVDASGSTALDRLAEAKGAVELLLADCYVRRDHVALIAFRGKSADLLLPPSRSLVRAKRCLASLPGGGGTPLASGLDSARLLGEALARKGQTPVIVVLTDGRANIDRNKNPGRASAERDAREAARALGISGIRTLVIDTSPRSEPFARSLAETMRGRYLPLPHANAQKLSHAVRAEIQDLT